MELLFDRSAVIFCSVVTFGSIILGELYSNIAPFMIIGMFSSIAIVLLIKIIEQNIINIITKTSKNYIVSNQLFYILMEECNGNIHQFFEKQYVRDIIIEYIQPKITNYQFISK
jgi:hypothetical protein